jgi:hypothetical protein
MSQKQEPENGLVVFNAQAGEIRFALSDDGQTLWGTRAQIAATFGCTERNVNIHIQNIYNEGELEEEATQKKSFLVQIEGGREVKRPVDMFNLDMILSVGYRVNSRNATEFRQWATRTLRQFIATGYTVDAERIANDPAAQQSLAELLRHIRHEEKTMYAKVRDVFKESSSDYNPNSQAAKTFFAMAQDKFHFAITGKTASELVLERADASKLNMGLRTVKGDVPTMDEVKTGKNYLTHDELRGLENICEQFMLFAESKAMRGKKMFMEELSHKLNTLLEVNEYPVLYEYKSYLKARADTHARLELERYRARVGSGKQAKQIGEAKQPRSPQKQK